MLKKIKYYLKFVVLTSFLFYACTESFDIESISFESALVIEASITTDEKFQEVHLSKAFKIDEDGPHPESNAIVSIKDENGITYEFSEITPGIYQSDAKFSASVNTVYQLFITTASGEVYESKPEKTSSTSQIDDVYATKDIGADGSEEFRINIDSYDPTGKSKYYRYTYEETYKIVAPYWSSLKFNILSRIPPLVEVIAKKDLSKKTCYQTKKSTLIFQTETTGLTEDRVTKYVLRRIPVDAFITSHRYSILVKQHVQSYEAYTYYSILNKFSNSSNLLSQNQPGFFNGNIYSTSNKDKKVIGFFEISSVSSKRMFFNYRDFFKYHRPPYPQTCENYAPEISPGFEEPPVPLIRAIESGNWLYFDINRVRDEIFPGPYLLKRKGCGDCTVYGSNSKPSFWVD